MSGRLGQIHDVAEELARSTGAIANLTVLSAERRVPAHVHANPYLALHVFGSYSDTDDGGDASISGPAAILYPAGSAHEMTIGADGLVTVIIEFECDRLGGIVGAAGSGGARRWIGGDVGHRASRLARAWLSGAPVAQRFGMTEAFLRSAVSTPQHRAGPPWLESVEALVAAEDGAPRTATVARRLGVSRPWLLRAYRLSRGEGLGQALRRRRVASASILLERLEAPLADVAAQAGFCDQSHMNRAFKLIVGRTPAAIRAARLGLSRQPRSTDPAP